MSLKVDAALLGAALCEHCDEDGKKDYSDIIHNQRCHPARLHRKGAAKNRAVRMIKRRFIVS